MGAFSVEKFCARRGLMEKRLKAEAPKVRIREDLYATITEIADQAPAGLGLSRTAIVDQALELWLVKRRGGSISDAVTPRDAHEREQLAAVLLFLRDAQAGKLHKVLTALLAPWLERINQGGNHHVPSPSGKKRSA